MDLREAYNLIAEDWHRDHQADDWWKAGTDAFLAALPPGARVLDAGCGSGVKARYLASHGFEVVGIDISEKLLAIARRENPGIDFREMSMTTLEFAPESFDAVFAQASLLHIPKKDAAGVVQAMTKLLKPEGLLYIAVKETRPDRPDEEVKQEEDYGYPYERFFSYFTLEELRAYMASAGLKVVLETREPSGRTVWLQIFGRRC